MTDRPVTVIGAMAHAEAAHAKIQAHEDICAVRYTNINTGLDDLKKLVWGVILGGGGFALVTLFAVILKAVKLA